MSDDAKKTTMELPCTACGCMAVEITLPKLGAVSRYGLQKLLTMQGAAIPDTESDTMGFTAAQMAASLGVRCLLCVEGITATLTPDESNNRDR